MEQEIKTYEQAVEYIENIPKFTGKNDLKDTRDFLDFLSHPEKEKKIIHIAGTNGKGSVCAYLCSLLMEAGFTVGTFISPHLEDMTERIRMNGIPVEREEFLTAFQEIYGEVKRKGTAYHPAYFEILFFMALAIFRRRRPDYVILETGLGGRLDSTNCVEQPLISVITRIGMDHMQYLGSTLEEIAAEKAGIIKPGVPVVYHSSVAAAAKVIEEKAGQVASPCFSVSKKDYALLNFKNKTIDFSYYSRYYGYVSLCLDTMALYQMENTALALRTAELLLPEGRVTPKVMRCAVRKTHWEGRMEEIAEGVLVDGAHNEDGIRAFLDSVRQDGCAGERYLIFGVVKDKAYRVIAEHIMESGLFGGIAAVGMKSARALTMEELRDTFAGWESEGIRFFSGAGQAYEVFQEKRKAADKIYAAGSLYLVGELKGYLRMRGSHD